MNVINFPVGATHVLAEHTNQKGDKLWTTLVKINENGFIIHTGMNGDQVLDLPWIRKNASPADNFWRVVGFYAEAEGKRIQEAIETAHLTKASGNSVMQNYEYQKMKVRKVA